ncbi:MAG: NTP transferase domain-containing protein [Spirochaetales bacterium]
MTAVFLQVRLSSQRYPRKALALLGDRTVFERCLQALSAVKTALHVVVTEPQSLAELSPLARALGWDVFSGPEDHVLERFVLAAREFRVTTVVRATGDNPLVSAHLANLLLARHLRKTSQYSGFQGGPLGSGVEVLDVAALETALASQPDTHEAEHVSPFLYRRPQAFRIDRPPVPKKFRHPEGSITLDTLDDGAYLEALWTELNPIAPPELEAVIPWLKTHPR